MPLLTFKYLPLRGAYIEAVHADWIHKQLRVLTEVFVEGRVGKPVLQFSGVTAIEIGFDRARPRSSFIKSFSENSGRYCIVTEAGEVVSVAASGYSLE